MKIESILIPIDFSFNNFHLLEYTYTLAKLFNSYIEGCAVNDELLRPIFFAPPGVVTTTRDAGRILPAIYKDNAFLNYMKMRDVPCVESAERRLSYKWNSDKYFSASEFGDKSRSFDLVITGRPNDQETVDWFGVIENIMFGGGPPFIVVPPGTFGRLCEVVLIILDNSKQLTNVVPNAIEILKYAKVIHILSLKEQFAESCVFDSILNQLSYNCIDCEIVTQRTQDRDSARTIIDYSVNHGMNLVVMSTLRMSPIRRFIFGDPTRDLLRETKIPIFISA